MMNTHFSEIKSTYFPEISVKGLRLSGRHTLEMALSDDDTLNFGLYPLISADMTGHNYIALRPLPGKPLDTWPVMLYSEQEGQGRIFSTSYRNWFPSYLIGNATIIKQLPDIKTDILAYGEQFGVETIAAIVEILLRDGKTADLSELYALSEPGSYLAQYHALVATNATRDVWDAYRTEYPHDNKSLRYLLEENMTADLAWELFERNLRYDFHNTGVLSRLLYKAGKLIVAEAPRPSSPYWAMIERIAACDSAYGFWDGGSGFFEAGKLFASTKNNLQALTCYENAIYLHGMDTEELHVEAYHAAVAIAAEVKDDNIDDVYG